MGNQLSQGYIICGRCQLAMCPPTDGSRCAQELQLSTCVVRSPSLLPFSLVQFIHRDFYWILVSFTHFSPFHSRLIDRYFTEKDGTDPLRDRCRPEQGPQGDQERRLPEPTLSQEGSKCLFLYSAHFGHFVSNSRF